MDDAYVLHFFFVCTRWALLWWQVHLFCVHTMHGSKPNDGRYHGPTTNTQQKLFVYNRKKNIKLNVERMKTNRLPCRHQWTMLTVYSQGKAFFSFSLRCQKCLSWSRTIRVETKYNKNTHTHIHQTSSARVCVRFGRCHCVVVAAAAAALWKVSFEQIVSFQRFYYTSSRAYKLITAVMK